MQGQNINYLTLKSALAATAKKRNSDKVVKNYENIINSVEINDTMNKHWKGYQKDFIYAIEISFKETCNAVRDIMGRLF